MTAWQVPARESLLPVLPEQSCAVCGSTDWAWLYWLLSAPGRVQNSGWFPNWFVVLCAPCQQNWAAADRAALAAAWSRWHGDTAPGLDDYWSVVNAMQSQPPQPRSEVSPE
jgi:hypothetical protein